jgi:hypothetical protein
VIGSNEDPIYDMEGHFQVFPLQLSYGVNDDSDNWKQGHDMITNIFQTPLDDLMLCSPNNFLSYLEEFDDCSFDHFDLLYVEYYQPPLCSDLDRGEDIACPTHGTCDEFIQPPFTLPRCVTKGVVGKTVPCIEFSPGQSLLLEFKGKLNTLRRSLLCHSSNFPLEIFQSFSIFLLVLSQTSGCDDIQGSQPSDSFQIYEPWIFHNPFLSWIDHFPKGVNWHDFFPPSRLHELEFTISDDTVHFLTHVIFVLDLSLFWLMMKHRGKYY